MTYSSSFYNLSLVEISKGRLSSSFPLIGTEDAKQICFSCLKWVIEDGKGALQKLKQPSKSFWNHSLNHRSICGNILQRSANHTAIIITLQFTQSTPFSHNNQTGFWEGFFLQLKPSQLLYVKKYPAVVFIVFYQCLFTTISAAFTLVAVRDASAWGAKAGCGADFYFICCKQIETLSCFGVERFFIVHKGYL
ncbi:unnamed protein product [Prunus armeniaca]